MRMQLRTACAAVVLAASVTASADNTTFTITNDPALDRAVSEARTEFLRDKTFNRLDATILVANPDGSWRRGSFNPEVINYPASCVKLAYLAAAMNWCRENNLPYTALDHCVRPMIEKSDNVQTGVTVDAITSAPNDATITTATDPRFDPWYRKRLYTENYLRGRGLLANQVIVHKTYPSNSGESPSGAEKAARDLRGPNQMQPQAAAALMLEIAKGAIEPGAHAYMMELLDHDRWKGNSMLGTGLPPGTKYHNKPGLAYDTLEDIAFVVLPNGQEVIVAAFSNGFTKPYSEDPSPHDGTVLGGFMELLMDKAGVLKGCPPVVRVDDEDPGFTAQGAWKRETAAPQKSGKSYHTARAGDAPSTATWQLRVPEDGRYEVCVRHPQDGANAADAPFSVVSDRGTTTVLVDQRKVGGRWRKLGDFTFRKGGGEVMLSNSVAGTSATVAADAVKASKWPGSN